MRRILLGFSVALSIGLSGCATLHEMGLLAGSDLRPHEHSDLRPDPRVVFGRLENGLRYAILPHAVPPGRVSVNLLVQVGSYQERDDERGYAHFVEHMVFRGSAAFPGDMAARALQQLGVAMGPDINATTSFFATDYFVNDLRLDDPAALATGLAVLRGFVGSATFDSAAVATERGVVLSERRSRAASLATAGAAPELMASNELLGPEIGAVYKGQRLAERMPIGTEDALNAATAEKLRAFYRRWYRPERMILAIAGDLAPADAEKLIRQTFADLAAPASPAPEPKGVASPGRRSSPWLNLVDAPGEPAIQLSFCAAERVAPDSTATRRQELIRAIAVNMVLARLEHAAEAEAAPITNTESVLSDAILGQEFTVIRVKTPAPVWLDAAGRIDAELRRTCAGGFTEAELGRQIRRERAAAEDEIYESAVRPAGTVARALALSMARALVFTSAEADRVRVEAELRAMTVTDCNRAIRQLFGHEARTMAAIGAFKNAEAEAPGVADRLRRNAVTPLPQYVDFAPLAFPYADLGRPGLIVTEVHDPKLDADLIQFANGVRLNLKRTMLEPHRANLVVRFGHGQLLRPPDQPGLAMRCFAWLLSGVGNLSFEQERASIPEMDGWTLTMSGSSTEFAIRAVGAAGGVPFAVQDFAAHFAHPVIRAKAWGRALDMARQVLAPYQYTAGGVAESALTARLTQNSSLTLPGIEEVGRSTAAEFQTWFLPQLTAGPIEVTVVGDFDLEAIRNLVARTFGALPILTGAEAPDVAARRIKDPPPHVAATLAFLGSGESAVARLAWTARDIVSPEDRVQSTILASILGNRLEAKLREEMGDTYSPETSFRFNDQFSPSPTALSASIEAAPDRVTVVAGVARDTAEKLGRDGVGAAEFERARQPLVFTEEANRRTNAWWTDVLESVQAEPALAAYKLNVLAGYRAATLDESNALAHRLLTADRYNQVLAVPAATLAKTFVAQAVATPGHTDVAAARAEFRRRVEHAPEFADLLGRVGSVAALGLDEDSLLADAFIDLSGERFNREDYAGALSADNQVITLHPTEPVGYLNRGAAKSGLGDYGGAIADYTKALELKPDYVVAFTNRAEAERQIRHYPAAIADLNRAIKLKPNDPNLYRARAAVRDVSGDKRGALSDLNSAIALLSAELSRISPGK